RVSRRPRCFAGPRRGLPEPVGAIEAARQSARAIRRGCVSPLASTEAKPPAAPVLILSLPFAVLALRQARHHRLAAGIVGTRDRRIRNHALVAAHELERCGIEPVNVVPEIQLSLLV